MDIYRDDLETRIKRVNLELNSRDYEGITTLHTSDLFEIMQFVKNCQRLISLLKVTEESDSGRVFRPTYITSCRTQHVMEIAKLLPKLGISEKPE